MGFQKNTKKKFLEEFRKELQTESGKEFNNSFRNLKRNSFRNLAWNSWRSHEGIFDGIVKGTLDTFPEFRQDILEKSLKQSVVELLEAQRRNSWWNLWRKYSSSLRNNNVINPWGNNKEKLRRNIWSNPRKIFLRNPGRISRGITEGLAGEIPNRTYLDTADIMY